MILKTGYGGVNWIIVVKKRDQQHASVNTEIHLRLF